MHLASLLLSLSCFHFVFPVADMPESEAGSDGTPPRPGSPVRRGKGLGGQKRHYATALGPAKRVEQFPVEPFTVKSTDAGDILWCLCCGKGVSHGANTFVTSHIGTKGHRAKASHE